ncbi:hypothetical protein [Mucilaginibacter phyllosphaerae]|uniref:Uncharacterized protein n=1 Tax=Mucilaginibacter phyllosphaerae TaxID=1812349 RepID=A0A4Y8ABR8_9SPHI|nr:hypothetical protein [Mucilaginibacter phyllosphaerae]MBB3969271.1 hypothetical protein [Mucilaginibacter phyllosphaerae]TEW65930.1 hypothetical protein E2R65_12435 [Mucilaginibacter phyllosphaerae]
MANIRTLTWYFYKPIYIINLIFTLICLLDIFKIGFWFIGYTIFIKAIGYMATIAYKNYFANKTYMYFRNAGYSITRMYVYAFAFDFFSYLTATILLILTLHGFAHIKS